VFFFFIENKAQEGIFTVGLQYKPIIPSNLFRAGETDIFTERTNLTYTISQKPGYSFGMIVRRGISKNWTFETGISYVKRNFTLEVADTDTSITIEKQTFSIIGYEVPLVMMLNVQLDEQLFMNAAFGTSIDIFPSSVGSANTQFDQISARKRWIQLAMLANIGWEYRTKKNGAIYIGGSYHRPFSAIYRTKITYYAKTYYDSTIGELSGNYLTVDLRYYFHDKNNERNSRKK
jgi:hypothetical protein